MCAGKPEKVRTSPFLVAPLWPCVAGGQKGQGCLFRTPFSLVHFFWRSKRNEHNSRRIKEGALLRHPLFIPYIETIDT